MQLQDAMLSATTLVKNMIAISTVTSLLLEDLYITAGAVRKSIPYRRKEMNQSPAPPTKKNLNKNGDKL